MILLFSTYLRGKPPKVEGEMIMKGIHPEHYLAKSYM